MWKLKQVAELEGRRSYPVVLILQLWERRTLAVGLQANIFFRNKSELYNKVGHDGIFRLTVLISLRVHTDNAINEPQFTHFVIHENIWTLIMKSRKLYITVRLWTNCRNSLLVTQLGRSQWPRGLRHELSSPARTLRLWVRIPLEAWMSVCVYYVFVLFCV
jgi:hypothetical protein